MAVAARYRHLQRYYEIAAVLVDEGFDALLEQIGLSRFASMWIRLSSRPRAPKGATLPERVRYTLEHLGPTFIKIGQLLSTRLDLVPPDFIDELRKLQDEVPPVPFEAVRQQIRDALGEEVEEIFATFDPVPLAAASIGQVHAATLHDGTPVVVKVQRPDVRRRIEVDLDILRSQAHFAERHTAWGYRYDLIDIAEEISRVLRLELDYCIEGRNAERFRRAFADDESVFVPAVYWEYTSDTVLTMERIQGIKLDDVEALRAAGIDPHDVARAGVNAYLRQIFLEGFFHADPHPGNLFVMEGGRIGFSDFGRVGTISERMKEQFADMFLALINRDEAETLDVLLDIGVATTDVNERELERELGKLFSRYYNATLQQIEVSGIVEHLLHLVWRYRLRIPSEFTLLLTTFSTLEGVARSLDPRFNVIEETRPFATQVLRLRLRPSSLARNAWHGLKRLNRLFLNVPESLEHVLRRMADGSFRLEVSPTGLGPVMAQARELVNRIAFAIVIGSFVVGFSLILRSEPLPRWMIIVSEIALLGAAFCGFWFFADIFYTMWRGRRRRIR